ncbi:hypothetical protein GJ699_09085 [Duganella sp. FT80W]|jgi:hypothetical protein|uniref:Uncharacterized protein n=1 Tax=Duganella guangzhouensis TaxID=2666084 RepID=A0A6I2KVN9_9BURK|nr:hypothetical protein [Duganella guangzhouensis]MRW90135.1 hypothetical protein [Duganella guangzhouensis]
MKTYGENSTQMDLFPDAALSLSQESIPSQNKPVAPVFVLQEHRLNKQVSDDKRLTRKVLALLEL